MATEVYRQLQIRRDIAANLPTLAEGELFWTTDTHHLYVGSNTGNILLF
jgi:hypothetical protein